MPPSLSAFLPVNVGGFLPGGTVKASRSPVARNSSPPNVAPLVAVASIDQPSGTEKARLFHVDAFTDRPFAGNPAMVCVLERGSPEPSTEWCLALADDVNLSETVFLYPNPDDSARYRIRWFAPRAEVKLCGHATLASSHVLFDLLAKDGVEKGPSKLEFDSLSGKLTVTREGKTIWMDFPSQTVTAIEKDAEVCDALATCLNYPATVFSFCGRTDSDDYFVVLPEETMIRDMTPNIPGMGSLPKHRGIIVTAAADSESNGDFVSRFFAPSVGVDEDPVTGSAHCALAPFWSSRLDKIDLVGLQCSRRKGIVNCRVRNDRVHLGGSAVSIFEGDISLDLPL